MVFAVSEIFNNDACCREVLYDSNSGSDPMKHTQQPEASQRQAVLTPHPPSPASPLIQRTAIYQLTPAPQDLMTPKTSLPVALEAMSSVWLPHNHQDLRQRDTALPVIESPRMATQGLREPHEKPSQGTGAKRNHGVIRSCFSDSFLHTRVEPLDDGLNNPFRPFRGLVLASQEHRRPSTPIVESATKSGLRARRQRYLSATDSPRTRQRETGKGAPVGRSESPTRLPNRTRAQRAVSKGGRSRKEAERRDSSTKEIDNESFCIWKEKTRSFRRASETSCKMQADQDTAKTERKEEEKTNTTKHEEFVIKHLNYCSSRKTNQVVKWLKEVNLQDSFDIID